MSPSRHLPGHVLMVIVLVLHFAVVLLHSQNAHKLCSPSSDPDGGAVPALTLLMHQAILRLSVPLALLHQQQRPLF